MMHWIKNIEFIRGWQWDAWHIACSLFIVAVVLMVRWIFIDSVRKNKEDKKLAQINNKKKVNGKGQKKGS